MKQRALISLSDKSGLEPLLKALDTAGIELISTGGTKKAIEIAGYKVLGIEEVTNFPEMLDGRVKTLHPMVHGGLLYRRDLESHVAQVKEHNIQSIDYVIVNLYPFFETISKPNVSFEEAKKHCLEWLPYAQKVQLGARTDPETYVRACISFATMR
jgi:phosphoribosylaminoimidazolecarboxamide formyltransferase/IMP cyclohydrolase